MGHIGHLVTYEIDPDLTTTATELKDLGLGLADLVPRNDYKSALIKALRIATKGNDRLYRRFNDKPDSVSFGIFYQSTSANDIDISKEFVLSLDKATGNVTYPTSGELPQLVLTILDAYNTGKATLNADQFRALVANIIKTHFGVSVRRGGGIYYFDKRNPVTNTGLEKLKSLFSAFPKSTLHQYRVADDDTDAAVAITDAVKTDVSEDWEAILNDTVSLAKDGKLTDKILENRIESINAVLEKVSVHEAHLRSEADTLKTKLDAAKAKFSEYVGSAKSVVAAPASFVDALSSL